MKKLLALLLTGVLALSLTACGEMGKAEEAKQGNAVLLYENPKDEKEATVAFDLDEDGKDEEVKASLTEDYYISVSSGDAEIKLGYGEAYYIYKIYGIDIDTKDKKKELVIISDEVSSDVMLRVLRFENGEFTLVNFENTDGYTGESYTHDTLSVGYDAEIEFAGKTLETSKRGRYGMWCVEAKYKFDGEVFEKVEIKERNVVRSSYEGMYKFISEEPEYYMEHGIIKDEDELENLKEGYVTAHTDLEISDKAPERKGAVTIKEGDVFKIIMEDSEGFVYVEKKKGESGWVYLGDFSDNRYEVSEIAFFMAD